MKTKFTQKIFMLVCVMTCVFMTSCKDKLSVSPAADISFSASGGERLLKIKSNTDWFARVDGSWLSLDKNEGSGDGTVTVTAKPLTGFNSRKSKLSIYDGGHEIEFNFNVTQEGLTKKGILEDNVWLSTQEVRADVDGGNSETIDSPLTIDFGTDGTYVTYEKDVHFWTERARGTWNVKDNLLTMESSVDTKECEIIHITATKLKLRYTENYLDKTTNRYLEKKVTREFNRDEYWVSPSEYQLSSYKVDLHSEDTYQIYTTGTDVSYTSADPFVAVVDEEGLVTAMFLGETTITVTANEGTHTLKVNVTPRYTYYEAPCLDFTKTKSQISEMYSGRYYYNDVSLLYPKGTYYHGYFFDGNALIASCIYAEGASYEKVRQYVAERYFFVIYDEDRDMGVYSNYEDMFVYILSYGASTPLKGGHLIQYQPFDFSEEKNVDERRMAVRERLPMQPMELSDFSSAITYAE